MIQSLDDEFVKSIIEKFGRKLQKINLSSNGLKSIVRIEEFALSVEILNLSKNLIVDLSPLSELLELRELDLSDNSITMVDSLRNLCKLESLDLRNNRISSIANLKPLAAIPSLRHLHLSGNPLCLDQNYPDSLFKMLKPVQAIDSRLRDDSLLMGTTDHNSVSATNGSSLSQRHSDDGQGTTGTSQLEIELLRMQLKAFENSFELQERVLAHNMHQPPSRTVTATTDSSEPPSHTLTRPAAFSHQPIQPDTNVEFPYIKILQLWRRTAVRNTFERVQAEASLSSTVAEFSKERENLQQKVLEAEAFSLSLRERHKASNSHIDFLESKINQLQSALMNEVNSKEAKSQIAQNKQHLRAYQDAVIQQLRVALDQSSVRAQAILLQCVDRLRVMEERTTAATQRVHLATALISQKDIILRNSLAAVEVERRLLTQTRRTLQQQTLRARGKALTPHGEMLSLPLSRAVTAIPSDKWADLEGEQHEDHPRDSDSVLSTSCVQSQALLSELQIPPQVESLLCSIFRQLDTLEEGCVSISLLVSCFCGPTTNVLLPSTPVSPSIPPNKGVSSLRSTEINISTTNVVKLYEIIRDALGERLLRRLSESLLHLQQKQLHCNEGTTDTLTWGEFLLLLVPVCNDGTKGGYPQTRLDPSDVRLLQRSRVWGDVEWSMIPLQIPEYSPVTQEIVDLRFALSNPAYDGEVVRLRHERQHLLGRLQYMVRSLDRRAEAIKACFEDELVQGRMREGKLQAQLSSSRSELMQQKDREAQLEDQFQCRLKHLESRAELVERDNQRLIAELDMSRDEWASKIQDSLVAEQERYRKLETEYQLSQREGGRREVRLRGLQRDVLRLQAALSTALEEMNGYKEQIRVAECQLEEHRRIITEVELRCQQFQLDNGELRTERDKLNEQLATANQELELFKRLNAAAEIDDGDGHHLGTEPSKRVHSNIPERNRNDRGLSADVLLREEMEFIRSLPTNQRKQNAGIVTSSHESRIYTPLSIQQSASSDRDGQNHMAITASQSDNKDEKQGDIYSAHLSRLLRLAEEAIGKG